MKNTRKFALYGTSADPPTYGHKIIIAELAKIYNIVIAYASDNPSKKHRENLVSRSLLLKTLIDDFKMTKIFFDQDLSSPWAIKTIKKCKKKYDIKQLDFVIGSDLLKEISSWKNINEIINEVNFFIIPREGYQIDIDDLEFIKNNHGNFEISLFKIPKISSSLIRENFNDTDIPRELLPIIRKNNLYTPIKKFK